MKDPFDPYRFDYDVDDGEYSGDNVTTKPSHFSNRIYHYHAIGLVRPSSIYPVSADEQW